VAEPPGGDPGAAVVLFSDIFGFALNNTRIWADRLANSTGFLVVLPDFFRWGRAPAFPPSLRPRAPPVTKPAAS
jgi:dienelactone hydrolase